MRTIALADGADFEGWRQAARNLLRDEVTPEQVTWLVGGEASLLAGPDETLPAVPARPAPRIPVEFLALMQSLICHSDPQRYGLAYRLLWRLTHGERTLLQLITDADVVRARSCEKNVRRDSHKMKAFLRFREVQADGVARAGAPADDSVFIAWFEPSHYILERVAPFFVRRFTGMRWSILTPYRSAHWDGETLHFSAGATKAEAPRDDLLEHYWRTYYASIFNPARLKVQAMKSEMPMKYWKNLPEAQLIPQLIRDARPRSLAMVQAAPTVPRKRFPAPEAAAAAPVLQGTLAALRLQASDCRACPLWQSATRTVFGAGPEGAPLMLVGDQPGDQDDLGGRPFSGPAGRLLDHLLAQAGLDREALYLTHAVKHFKFTASNIFRRPEMVNADEQRACRHWLEAEIRHLRPRLILCLGATAASSLIEEDFQLSAQRGQWHLWPDGTRLMASLHPSSLLQFKDGPLRDQAAALLLGDLRMVAQALAADSHTPFETGTVDHD